MFGFDVMRLLLALRSHLLQSTWAIRSTIGNIIVHLEELATSSGPRTQTAGTTECGFLFVCLTHSVYTMHTAFENNRNLPKSTRRERVSERLINIISQHVPLKMMIMTIAIVIIYKIIATCYLHTYLLFVFQWVHCQRWMTEPHYQVQTALTMLMLQIVADRLIRMRLPNFDRSLLVLCELNGVIFFFAFVRRVRVCVW